MRTVRDARWIPGLLVVILAALAAAAAIALDFPQPARAQSDDPTGRIVVRPLVDDDGELTRVEFGFRPAWGEDVRGGGDGPDDLFPPKRFLTQRLIENSAGRWLRSSEILIPDAAGSEDGVRGRILVRAEADDDGELTRIEFGFRPDWGADIRGAESGPDDIFPTNRFLTRVLIDRSAAQWLRSSLITAPAERPVQPTEPTEGATGETSEVGVDGGAATAEDGATITVPPGAAAVGAKITARVLPEEELPPLPGRSAERLGGWDFEVEGELTGRVTLSLPLPADEDETWFLGHYDGERWYLEPFTVEDGMITVQTASLSLWETIKGVPVVGDVASALEDGGRYFVEGVKVIGEAVWDGITWTVDWTGEQLGLKDPIVCESPDDSVGVTNPTGGGLVGIYLKGCAQQTSDGPLLLARNPRHIWFEVRPVEGNPEHATPQDIYKWLSGHDEGTLLGPGAIGDWRPTTDGTVRLRADMTWTAAGMTVLYQPIREMIEAVVGFALPSSALTELVETLLTADELRVAAQEFERGNHVAALEAAASALVSATMRDLVIDLIIAVAQRSGVTIKKAALIKAYAAYKVGELLVKRVRAGVEFFKVLIADDEERLGTVAYAVPRSVCWGGDITEGTVNGRWNHACQSQRLDGSYTRYYRFELDETQEVTLDLDSSLRSAVYVSEGITRTAKPVRAFTEASDWARAEMEAGTYTIEVATRGPRRTGTFNLRVELAGAEDGESDDDEPEPLPPIGDGSLVVLAGTRDLYQMHVVDGSLFKRLILNPVVFNGYGFQLSDVRSVEQAEFDRWTTTDLARLGDDAQVWRLFPDGGEGVRRLLDITAEQFVAAGFDWDAVISINQTEFDAWTEGPPITAAELGFESSQDDGPEGSAGRFVAVSAGSNHTCGLRESGEVECWGDNRLGESDAPAGRFTAVSASNQYTCGVLESGEIECWGSNWSGESDSPAGRFTAVSASNNYACAIRESGKIACWGSDSHSTTWLAGDDGNEMLTRWVHGLTDAPAGNFASVSTSGSYACGVRESGEIECWGSNWYGESDSPAGRFTAVSTGSHLACAIRKATAELECWGNAVENWDETVRPILAGSRIAAVSADLNHSCALRESGEIECWGTNSFGQTNVPEGSFTAVTAGGNGHLGAGHTCGLRNDGTIVCWGNNESGQTDAPGGSTTGTPPIRPPQIDTIRCSPSSPQVREAVTCTARLGGDAPTSYSWSGGSSSGSRSRYTTSWSSAGTYTVNLTVSNGGGSASAGTGIVVRSRPPEPPQIRITCPAYVETGRSFRCTVRNRGGAVDTWYWSASGGTPSGRDETYSLWISSFGRHIVQLTASNAGGSDSDWTSVQLVAAPPVSQYSRCGSDRIRVWWFDRDNFRKHHVNLTGDEATRILGPRWWATIGHLTQPACDSWPTGAPLTAENYR